MFHAESSFSDHCVLVGGLSHIQSTIVMDANREPCPYRIFDDCGNAFAMGKFPHGPTVWSDCHTPICCLVAIHYPLYYYPVCCLVTIHFPVCYYPMYCLVTIRVTTGAIGGSIWHFFSGARNAPKGYRLNGSMNAIKARAPNLGGKSILQRKFPTYSRSSCAAFRPFVIVLS